MGWYGPNSRSDLRNFRALYDELRTAKSYMNGKPLENNTRAFLRKGTMADPETIAVRLHSTDILLFHADGSMEVTQSSWTASVTTKDRLREYGGVSVREYSVPPVNGLRTFPNKVPMMWVNGGPNYGVAIGTDSGYIRVNPDKSFDMSTVTPHQVQYVSDPTKLRRKMVKMHKMIKLVHGYLKLKGEVWADPDFEGTVSPLTWLEQRLDVPLEEVELSPFPYFFRGSSMTDQLKKCLDGMRRDIATREKCLARLEVLKTE